MPLASLLGVLLSFSIVSASELPSPKDGPVERALLGPGFLEPVLPYEADLVEQLQGRDHAAAAKSLLAFDKHKLRGREVRAHAFVTAWTLIRAGRASEAVHLVEEVAAAEGVPADYRAVTVAELWIAQGDYLKAVETLRGMPGDTRLAVRGKLLLATAHEKSGATADALRIYEELAARPDPADGSEFALQVLARRKGTGSSASNAYLRRLWSFYPRTGPGREAERLLEGVSKPSHLDLARRAERYMDAGDFDAAVELLNPLLPTLNAADEGSCIAWYTWGRSQFKRNNVTAAAEVLVPAGKKCAKIDKDRGARSLYVAGTALERKKDWLGAADAFASIPRLYPEHSMADDGYARGGIALANADRDREARALWESQVATYPTGDLAAEGWWRIAWGRYQEGDTPGAIAAVDELVDRVDPVGDPVHWFAGRYWQARWRIWPSFSSPKTRTSDAKDLAEGIELFKVLLEEHPTSFYSLLGAARLHELDPLAVSKIKRPGPTGAPRNWTVRAAWVDHPRIAAGMALMRLGLHSDALAELEAFPSDELLPSEFAILREIEAKKDPMRSHDALHKYLLERPADMLGPDRDRILRLAFPNTWWPEVQTASAPYSKRLDPRVFHALVREESSFNPRAVSWAGARGLAQLMPATARHVATKVGRKVGNDDLFKPEVNLALGAWYLDYLHGYFAGNPFMAVPAYNAGEGNVGSWAKEWGSRPTDEFIEAIPIRETRHYVKRVLGTYQLYQAVWGEGELYPDWSRWNHTAWKK